MSFTLSKEDFSRLHNARVYLLHIFDELEDILHPSLTAKGRQYLAELNEGMEDIYRQEDEDLERKTDLYNRIQQENKFFTTWSADEIEDFSAIPYPEVRSIVYQAHWGPKSVTVVTVTFDEPATWLDLWRYAERAIQLSTDTHHIFIERFTITKYDNTVLELSTGS